MIRSLVHSYRKVEPFVFDLIKAQFCIQLVNSAFFILLNFYLIENDYKDYEIANFIAWRYASVALLGIPFGFFIKGRNLKNIMLLGAVLFPIISLAILFCIPTKNFIVLKGLMALYSFSFLFLQVTPLPFIMKYCKESTQSEAISLQFQVWGLAVMSVGFISYFLKWINNSFFSDKNLLILFCLIGTLSIYYIAKIKVVVEKEIKTPFTLDTLKEYDWKLIWKSTIAVQLIATGAGFTIPFFSLFFQKVFNFSAASFSILTSFTHLLVAFAMFITPWIKKRFGYTLGIIFLQSTAVLCLILFATTEWYSHLSFALYIAIFTYAIRQPLMNSAAPLTSELSLEYVGPKNREMISAIDASIWNSGWLFSAIIFEYLRRNNLEYSYIFLITAALYSFGIIANYLIIKDLNKRSKKEIVAE